MKTAATLLATVLALGVTILAPRASAQSPDGQQGGPREIEKCQTISKPGSYKLIGNLTANGDCLAITASFVTIDLAGFTITEGAVLGTAISARDQQDIAVRNGSISGFGAGVVLGSGSVEGLRVVASIQPGASGISATGIVKGNRVTGAGFSPIGTGSVGISATGIVTGNLVDGNFQGMEIGQGSTVIGNTALGNRGLGISVDCPSNVTNNTTVNTFEGPNLVLNGDGCNNTNNVAP